MSVPVLVGGVLGLIGGSFGLNGALRRSTGAAITSTAVLGTSALFLFIGAMISLWMSAYFAGACEALSSCSGDTRACQQFEYFDPSGMCNTEEYCCECERQPAGVVLRIVCEENKNWICSLGGLKIGVIIVSLLSFVAAIVSSSFGCGATCCCPHAFDFHGTRPVLRGAVLKDVDGGNVDVTNIQGSSSVAVVGKPVSVDTE